MSPHRVVRLTARDEHVLTRIGDLFWTHRNDVARLMSLGSCSTGLSLRTANARITALAGAGLVKFAPGRENQARAMALTRAGAQACGFEGPLVGSYPTALRHTLTVAAVAVSAWRAGWSWEPEWRLASRSEYRHLPDGVARKGSSTMVVEVELTSKGPRRWSDIVLSHAADGAQAIQYFAPASLAVRLNRWADEFLSPSVRELLEVRVISVRS